MNNGFREKLEDNYEENFRGGKLRESSAKRSNTQYI